MHIKTAKIMPLLSKTERYQFCKLAMKMAKIITKAEKNEESIEVVEHESSPVTKTTVTHG